MLLPGGHVNRRVPAVIVIRRDLLVAASGVPDVPLVVSWVPRLGRRPIMGWCRGC